MNTITTIDPNTIAALSMKFGAKIKRTLRPILNELNDSRREAPASLECEVRYIEYMPEVDGIMCHMVLKLKGSILLDELFGVLSPLESYTHNETARVLIDGRYWELSDGDDQLAVWFEGGEIRIWLRGWSNVETP